MDLRGRVALVTGASGTLGAAIAHELAHAGASLALTYESSEERAHEVAATLREIGVEVWVGRLDLATADMPAAVVAALQDRFGRLDVVVNNAAWNIGIPFEDLESLTPEIWDRVHSTDLRGPYMLVRAAAAELRRTRGRVVNIASVAGLHPEGSSIAYATAKAALIHLTRCLAVALAPEVAVNCVAPGLIEGTRMSARLPDSVVESVRARALLGHAASPADIAAQVLALCRSDSTTGQVVAVDGGLFLHS